MNPHGAATAGCQPMSHVHTQLCIPLHALLHTHTGTTDIPTHMPDHTSRGPGNPLPDAEMGHKRMPRSQRASILMDKGNPGPRAQELVKPGG